MSITYALLSIQPLLLLLMMIIFFAAGGGTITWLFRKHIRLRILQSHNDVIGNIFACTGGLYSLLLAFVVFLVWDSYNNAEAHANMEFSIAKGLYRDIEYYPDTTESMKIKQVYLAFIDEVINSEYPALARLKPVPQSSTEAFNNVFRVIEGVSPSDQNHIARASEMFRHLNELATSRSLRHLAAGSGIPFEIWLPMVIGGFITMIFAIMLDIENVRLHIFLNALLGAFIGMVLYLIVILDYPFSGHFCIEPAGYVELLKWGKGG